MLREPRPNPKAEQPTAPKPSRFRVVKLEARIAPVGLGGPFPWRHNLRYGKYPRTF
jgi:hypothetical protein